MGRNMTNWTHEPEDDDSPDSNQQEWIVGVDFIKCEYCWQDTDAFEVEVMPQVFLSGELHRDPDWDAACGTKRRLRLRDFRGV